MVVDAGMAVANLGEPLRQRRQGEVRRIAGVDLVPAKGCRYASIGLRPYGVRASDGAVFRVLVVVEEDAVALLLPPLARRQRRRATLDLSSEGQCRATYLIERPRAHDAYRNVHPTRARRLRPADQPEIVERRVDDLRDLAKLIPADARHRIEIDPQLVRVIEIVGTYRMRVQFEAGEVRHPGQTCRITRHDFLRVATGRKAQRDDVNPGRPRGRRALLVEELAVDAVGIADEHVRPIAVRAKRSVGDSQVVADEIELGVAGLGKENLAGVRDWNLASAHLDDFLLDLARHLDMLTGGPGGPPSRVLAILDWLTYALSARGRGARRSGPR